MLKLCDNFPERKHSENNTCKKNAEKNKYECWNGKC